MGVKKISRIATLDIIRGYLLIGILIDHINFFPNGLDWWSARGGLFVTMAEGFFLISGIVLGMVRGAKMIDKPLKSVARLLVSRGLKLYIISAVLTLVFTGLAWMFFMDNPGLKPDIAPAGTPWWSLLWDTLTLQYFYGWADYLRLYAVFLLASPLIVWLLRRGWWYVGLAASLAVWTLFPDPLATSGIDQERAQLLSWQLLFFIGVTIGFYWPNIRDWWASLSSSVRKWTKVSLWTAALITLLYNAAIMLSTMGYELSVIGATPQLQHDLYIAFFDKERLPLVRILLFMVWFWAAYFAVRKFEPLILRWLGWLLVPLGTNSLSVYTMHAFMIFFIHLYFSAGSIWFNLSVALSAIGLTLLILEVARRIKERRRA